MFKKSFIQNIALVFISTFLALFIINAGLEIHFLSKNKIAENLKREMIKRGVNYDNRYIKEVVLSARDEGEECFAAMCSNIILRAGWTKKLVPLSGIPNTRTINCNELGIFSEYKSDRYGFNNPDQSWEIFSNEKNLDFILLGDSFTQGSCVPQKYTIAGQIRNFGYSALSLGCSANGPLASLAALREYGKLGSTKNIVYIFTAGNDIYDLVEEEKTILNKYFEDESFLQNLSSDNNKLKVVSHLKKFHDERLYSYFHNNDMNLVMRNITESENQFSVHRIFKLTHLRWKIGKADLVGNWYRYNKFKKIKANYESNEYKKNMSKFYNVVQKIQDTAREQNAKFIVAYLYSPNRDNKAMTDAAKSFNFLFKEKILKNLNDMEIQVIDLESALKKIEDQDSLYPLGDAKTLGMHFGHFSPKGYEIIAEEITKVIQNQ